MSDSLKFYKGWVTHVIDPSSFWMQIGTDNNFDLFRVYQASVDDYFNTHGGDLFVAASSLSPGHCVIVKKHYDHQRSQWRRAQVSRVEGNSVDVFYVDYGYAEILDITDVRSINRPFFEYLAPQAIRVGLAGIQPLTRSWTSRAVSAFEERVIHKSVIVNILEMDESQSLIVALYRRGDDGDWYSVTHGMLEEDLGLPNAYTAGFEKCISHDVVDRALLLMEIEESAETPEEDQEAETTEEVQEAETPEEVQEAETVEEVQEAETPEEIQEIEVSKEVQGEEHEFSIEREENRTFKEVWEDTIEDLEESSSEDEAEETKAKRDQSNNATGLVHVGSISNQIVPQQEDKKSPLPCP
ncbi:hypothetical protein EGW08_000371, partial [Elysia chlorotica]